MFDDILYSAIALNDHERFSGRPTTVARCSRLSFRRIHQCGSYGSSKIAAGLPNPGRLSNSPASIAARILLSAMIRIARSVINAGLLIAFYFTTEDAENTKLVKPFVIANLSFVIESHLKWPVTNDHLPMTDLLLVSAANHVSRRISSAAFLPQAPRTPPPGWLAAPHK